MRVRESLLGVSFGGMEAVARGVVTVARFFLVLVVFLRLFLVVALVDLVEALVDVDFFLVLFFLVFFLAAEAWEVSNISVSNISGRPSQSHTPKEIAPAANSVRYLLLFIICKITKNSTYGQP